MDFYLRPDDLPPEELECDPEDDREELWEEPAEELWEELLLDTDPELNDLGEELPLDTDPELNDLGEELLLDTDPELNDLGEELLLDTDPELYDLGEDAEEYKRVCGEPTDRDDLEPLLFTSWKLLPLFTPAVLFLL